MPEFSYIVPNQCNDMHSKCAGKDSVRAGDDWLAANVPAMVAAGATVILTWDESSGERRADYGHLWGRRHPRQRRHLVHTLQPARRA